MTQATCESIEPLLQAHRDGELTSEETLTVREHLAACAACREVDAELDALGGQLRDMHQTIGAEPVQVSVPGVPSAAPADPAVQAAVAAAFAKKKAAPRSEPSGIGAAARRIGGYEIESEIARGGMGRVYRALQVSMDRPVALKVLAPHLSENEKYVARFLREARVAATIAHPNLVAIYDVGQDGKQLYYSMELVDGDDLELRLGNGPLEQREVARIGLGVAKALQAANASNVIHRDIKPANILLTSDGAIKLADLGLAKDVENQDSTLTVSKTIIGSPNYMSPEQAEDLRKATHRSDIYMLGATLLHLVTGEVPFGTGSPIEILARVLRDSPSIPDIVEGQPFDPRLRAIIGRCLEKDPQARYEDATQLIADLELFLSDAKLPHLTRSKSKRMRRSGRLRRSGSSERRVLRSDSSGSGVATRRAKGGIPPAFFVAAAALLLGAIALGIMAGGSGPEGDGEDVVHTPAPEAPPEAPKPPLKDMSPDEIVDSIDGDGDSSVATDEPSDDGQPSEPVDDFEPAPRDEEPQLALGEPEADTQLAALVRFRDENPEQLGETFRRARDLASRFPQAQKAEQIRDDARDRLHELLDEVAKKAESYEKDGRLYDAQQEYAAYLSDFGDDVPGGAQAQLARRSLENQINTSYTSDLERAEALAAQGKPDEAEALLARVERYAGKEQARQARKSLKPVLVAARKDAPKDSGDEGDAMAAGLQAAQEQLAMAHQAVEAGRLDRARRLLERLEKEHGEAEELRKDLASLRKAIDEATPKGPELGELLAAILPGAEVEVLEGNRVRLGYGFSDDAEVEDWRETGVPKNQAQKRLFDYVNQGRKAKYDPWTVQKGHLAGYGYTRRQLRASFTAEEPLEVEVEAKGKQNLLVGFEGGGTTVAGFGYMLEPVRVAELMRGAGGGVKRYFERMSANIATSRKRGPTMAVFREENMFQHKELYATPLKLKRKTKFAVELRRHDDGEGQLIVLKAGKRLREPVDLEKPTRGPVSVTLLTLGALAAYDKVIVTGTLSEQFRNRMNQALREGGSLEKAREVFMKGERRRAGEGQGGRDRDGDEGRDRDEERDDDERERGRNNRGR